MEHKKIFYFIVIMQVVFLLGMIALKHSTVYFGTKVILKTVPYDPTEFFRGDYINIRYDISRINPDAIKNNNEEFKNADSIFVRLEKDKDYWKAAEISKNRFSGDYIKGTVKSVDKKKSYTIKEENSSKDYMYDEYVYDYPGHSAKERLQIGDKIQFTVFNNIVSYPYKCENNICSYASDQYNQYRTGRITNIKKDLKELNIEYPISSYFVPKNQGNLAQFRNGQMLVEVALWNGDAVATNLLIDGRPIDFR